MACMLDAMKISGEAQRGSRAKQAAADGWLDARDPRTWKESTSTLARRLKTASSSKSAAPRTALRVAHPKA